jgi:2-oxo-4-hydroxy-4-carboxy--5-ureidoimidazoline (OHCU) decarboxylase
MFLKTIKMGKCLIRKSLNDSNEEQNCSLISKTNKTNANKVKNLKRRYNEEYLKFGFITILYVREDFTICLKTLKIN